nr:hypothetical protein [Tanacetum cinerariifolium]
DLFLSDNSIPPGIENIADDPEGDIHFLEELLIDDSILSHESFDYDDDFEDIEYIEDLLFDPEIVSIEEENSVEAENVVQQEQEDIDLEDISQIQDIVLREKLLSITRLIS